MFLHWCFTNAEHESRVLSRPLPRGQHQIDLSGLHFIESCLGADPGFSFRGGGGGRKRLCAIYALITKRRCEVVF